MNGTDKEINDAKYDNTPDGYDFLVTGHESFGRVLEAGSNVQGLTNPATTWWPPSNGPLPTSGVCRGELSCLIRDLGN